MLDESIQSVKKFFGMNYDNVFQRLDNNGDGRVNTITEIRALMFSDYLIPPGAPKLYEEIEDIKVL